MNDSLIPLFVLAFFATAFAGWVTHICWVIDKITSGVVSGGEMAIGVLGAFIPPFGAIHGIILWFS